MQKPQTITTFSHEHGYYELYQLHGQFFLTFCPKVSYLKQKYGKAAMLYLDDVTTDDIGFIQNPFYVIDKVIKALVVYVKLHDLSHFYFATSTARRNKIYVWLSQRIVKELPDYSVSHDDNYFYFHKC
ncbi:hypothetical protein A9308_07435 [Moraxella atlantae]|uniref:Uncharacterized protein n=1 Tax=Faucicola atlantae TaxID=34059 RepID=A0A1B8QB69_9GAMM|nr:hypothetical protein [Moraxella atlantae]OBX76758.1 hypothetical protein A9308_07435 [Moraxella atlantae]